MVRHVALAMVSVLSLGPRPATAATSKDEIGVLTCDVGDGHGFTVFTKLQLQCTFDAFDGTKTSYVGDLKRYGIDVGYWTQRQMLWMVLAPAFNVTETPLAGTYGGITAEVGLGSGVSLHLLVGGIDNTISLQPLALGVYSGSSIVGGMEILTLTPKS